MSNPTEFSCPECLSPADDKDGVLTCSVCDWNEKSSPNRSEELGELEECDWEDIADIDLLEA